MAISPNKLPSPNWNGGFLGVILWNPTSHPAKAIAGPKHSKIAKSGAKLFSEAMKNQ